MSISRRELLKTAGAAGMLGLAPRWAGAQVDAPEQAELTIAVGGAGLLYYLPLSVAHLKGFFKDEGLDVRVADFPDGDQAMQSVIGGDADVVSGAFEQTIRLQIKGQFCRSFVLQGRTPMSVLAVSRRQLPDYHSPDDLRGRKIGVTTDESSTRMMASFFLVQHGVAPTDVSFVSVGAGEEAVDALRSGRIDAIANLDPVISTLQNEQAIRIIADTRTLGDTQAIFGGNMPSGCLFAPQSFIDGHTNTVQAITDGLVRASKWIQSATPQEIASLVPQAWQLGDSARYEQALENNREALSPDGMMPEDGPLTALSALDAFEPGFDRININLSSNWTNQFVARANQKYPHA